MFIPDIYPEPNNIKLSSGNLTVGDRIGTYIDDKIKNEIAGIGESLKKILKTDFDLVGIDEAGIILRKLNTEDITSVNAFFRRNYNIDYLNDDTFFLNVSGQKVVIAALSKEGFHYAVETLKQMLLEKGEHITFIKNGYVFDYPCRDTRAVGLDLSMSEDITFLERLLPVLVDLKYNTLYYKKESNSSDDVITAIKMLCG
jgi:hypothetical protein